MDSGSTGAEKKQPKKRGRKKGQKSSYTVSEKALAQRRKNTAIPLPETDEERSYNSALIKHIMAINEIAQNADRSDINSLKSCFINYLQLCYQDGMPITNLQAYAAMGFDNTQFICWARTNIPERKELATFVRTTCAMSREAMVSSGKLNPVIGIFWQRNFDGLRNDTEQVQNATLEAEDDSDTGSSYKDKYKNLIGE